MGYYDFSKERTSIPMPKTSKNYPKEKSCFVDRNRVSRMKVTVKESYNKKGKSR